MSGLNLIPSSLEWSVTIAHLMATTVMVGVIWFVQIVHYPLKAHVGSTAFEAYQEAHMNRTGWVVGPAMVTELLTALALTLDLSARGHSWWAAVGMLLLIAIWISTATLQVPDHWTLQKGFNARVHRHLVRTNWVRTILWSARAMIALVMMHQYLEVTHGT